MSWDGFIPDNVEVKCRICGFILESKDSGYPSRAMGIFNGLCYPCTSSNPFLQAKWADGCELWNFPPHLPSWRRDRETFFYHPSCTNPECDHGRIYRTRSFASGGSYYDSCDYCFAKFIENKYRKHARLQYELVLRIADRVYNRQLGKIVYTDDQEYNDHTENEIREALLDRVARLKFWARLQKENLEPKKIYSHPYEERGTNLFQ